MLLLLLSTALSDGAVPFNLFVNDANFSGSWELSDNCPDLPDRIVLVESMSASRSGYAWRLRRTPIGGWSARFTFSVPNSSSVCRGGVFITDEFGATGPRFGGPVKYNGSAILFEISKGVIAFQFETNGVSSPPVAFPLPTATLGLTIDFTNDTSVRVNSTVGAIRTFNGRGDKQWLSLTADCPVNGTAFSIVSADLSFKDKKPERPPPVAIDESRPLRDLDFQILSRVISEWPDKEAASVVVVLDAMVEIGRVVAKSSKLSNTKAVIENAMHNYTDAWRRRSLVMTAETETLRMSIAAEVGTVSWLIEDFRWNVEHELADLTVKAKGFRDSVLQGIKEIIQDINSDRRLETGTPTFVKVLVVIALAEIVVLGLRALRLKKKERRAVS
jgi:hypothetical protein